MTATVDSTVVSGNETAGVYGAADGAGHTCQCQSQQAAPEQFVYALGQLDVRMPTIGIEREFQQRERQLTPGAARGDRRDGRIAEVLRANPHIARSVCFLLSVAGVPAYVVAPTGRDVLDTLLDALDRKGEGAWVLVIGRAGPMAGPATCGGVVAPIVACDQVYAFTTQELMTSLAQALEPVPALKNLEPGRLTALGIDLFDRIAGAIDNVGRLDSSRALNYLLVQHPGLFLAYAARAETAVLDSIETRVNDTPGLRRIVSVILTFLDRATGVPERVFARVDTTEEWPFLADASHGGAPTLGLRPFVDHGPQGSTFL